MKQFIIKRNDVKQFLSIVFLFWSFSALAQTEPYIYEYKKGKTILTYSYIHRNDNMFIYGNLQDHKTNAPITDINITLKDFRIGTVTTPAGNFKIFLPRQEGTIVFDKPTYTYFEFDYKFKKEFTNTDKKEYSKKPSAHH